jgi:hypothetical protein
MNYFKEITMRKLLLCLAVTATCLLPSPRSTVAANPCGTYCCHPGPRPPATSCVYDGALTTCDAYWTLTQAHCR